MEIVKPVMFKNNPGAFVLGCVIPVLGWLALLIWWLKCITTSLRLEGERLIYGEGILARATNEIRLRDIRSIHVRQTFLQRIFGSGDVHIITAGDRPEISILGVDHPQEVRDQIEAARPS